MMQLYIPATLTAYAPTTDPDQPTEDHIRLLHGHMMLWPHEELHATISTSRWLLQRPDDREYHEAVQRNSRLEHRARIAAAERELAHRARHRISYPHVETGWLREFIDDLKRRVSTVDEIDMAVGLRRRGSVMAGRCPFHDDNDPSLIVWPDSQRWYCFACNIGGDVLAWVQTWQRCRFSDAVVYLASRAGVPLPKKATARPDNASRDGTDDGFEYQRGKVIPS